MRFVYALLLVAGCGSPFVTGNCTPPRDGGSVWCANDTRVVSACVDRSGNKICRGGGNVLPETCYVCTGTFVDGCPTSTPNDIPYCVHDCTNC